MGVETIENLKRQAARGSRRHFLLLVDKVDKGEPGARAALEELAPPTDDADADAADGPSAADCSREAFWVELFEVKELLNEDPSSVAPLDDLRRRARMFGSCEEVQAMVLEAYRLRLLGHLRSAGRLLDQAEALGAGCRACLLAVGHRRAILRTALGDHAAALARIEVTLAGYRELGPGHDLDGDGVANCLAIRGKIRDFLGDMPGAVADLGASVERWPPQARPFLDGLLDLGVALKRSGQCEEAYQLLRKPRLKFRSMQRCAHRAVFDLLDGQLECERGSKNRDRGRKKIRDAVDGFAACNMPDEFLRAAADYVKSIRRDPAAVHEFLKEIHGTAMRLVTAPEHLRRLQVLLDLSRELSGGIPSRSLRRRLEETVEETIAELRAGITAPGLPCLIS